MLRSRAGPRAPRIHPRWSPHQPPSESSRISGEKKPNHRPPQAGSRCTPSLRCGRPVSVVCVLALLLIIGFAVLRFGSWHMYGLPPFSTTKLREANREDHIANASATPHAEERPTHGHSITSKSRHSHPNLQVTGGHNPAKTERLSWPPTVTILPDLRPTSDHPSKIPTSAHVGAAELDSQFCVDVPCRLLVPLTIIEREPKAQDHLAQLLVLARSLNRTLVLPNAAKGKLGACLRWPFDLYLDIASTVKASGSPVIMMDDFRAWTDVRARPPIAQVIAVGDTDGVDDDAGTLLYSFEDDVRIVADNSEKLLERARCLKSKFRHLDLDEYTPLYVYLSPSLPPAFPTDDPITDHVLVEALTRHDVRLASWQGALGSPHQELDSSSNDAEHVLQPSKSSVPDPEVLLVHWDMHHLPLRTPAFPLAYSAQLQQLADRLVSPLGPYLVVHWNLAKLASDRLPACAYALLDTLDTLLHDESIASGVNTVWLSAEVPQDAPAHVAVLDGVYDAFATGGELAEWRLTGLRTELARLGDGAVLGGTDDESALEDAGVAEIVENMVAMGAALFVSSSKSCGRVSASSKQVLDFRTRTDWDFPRNVVTVFG